MKHIAWTLVAALAGMLAAAPAEATKKKSSSSSGYSSGSGHSSSSRGSRGSGIATGIGAAAIGYGLTGGIQRAIANTPDHRCTTYGCDEEDRWQRQNTRDNIRSRSPEELKQLRAIAKQRQNTPEHRADQDAQAGRETMNLFLGIGAGMLGR